MTIYFPFSGRNYLWNLYDDVIFGGGGKEVVLVWRNSTTSRLQDSLANACVAYDLLLWLNQVSQKKLGQTTSNTLENSLSVY